ncbi:LysR family transcriptional regulator [Serratia marcescens]|nr:LysR family transcriptional regulator [Serratia marcescens]
MELRHLRYFIAVAEERNFSRAAERLHISQPPLSRQIQQLEASLGVRLFERDSRPLALTEAGRFLYGHALQFLAQSLELKSMTQRVGLVERPLSLGFVASTLYDILPQLIRRFRASCPEVGLTLHEMTTLEQIGALKEGKIDVGFGRIRHEDIHIRRIVLREEPLMAALAADHPLARSAGLTLRAAGGNADRISADAPAKLCRSGAGGISRSRAGAAKDHGSTRASGRIGPGRRRRWHRAGPPLPAQPEAPGRDLQRIGRAASDFPIIMSTRQLDESEDIATLLQMIYALYDEQGIAYIKSAPAG